MSDLESASEELEMLEGGVRSMARPRPRPRPRPVARITPRSSSRINPKSTSRRALESRQKQQTKKINEKHNQEKARLAKEHQARKLPREQRIKEQTALRSKQTKELTKAKSSGEVLLKKTAAKKAGEKSKKAVGEKLKSGLGMAPGAGLLGLGAAAFATLGQAVQGAASVTTGLLSLGSAGLQAAGEIGAAGLNAAGNMGTAAINALGELASGLGGAYPMPTNLTGYSPEEDAGYDEENPGNDYAKDCDGDYDYNINKCEWVREQRILQQCIGKYGAAVKTDSTNTSVNNPIAKMKECIVAYDIAMRGCIQNADTALEQCQNTGANTSANTNQ